MLVRISSFLLAGILALSCASSPALASIEEPTLEEAVQWLKEAILEQNVPMRNRMYFRLRILEQENKGTVAPAVLPLLNAQEDAVAEYAAFLLGWIEDPQAIDPLLKMLESGKEGRIRHATRALGFMRAKKAQPALEKLLTHSTPHVRADAVFALGQLEDPAVLPVIEKFLAQEKDELVRHFAQEAITWIQRYAQNG